MASNIDSTQTDIFGTTYEGIENHGGRPNTPDAEFASQPASTGIPSLHEQNERVASPRTQARQEEMARLIFSEQQRYLDNANASETGSAMDRHMIEYMRCLEDAATASQPNAGTNHVENGEASTTVNHVDDGQSSLSTDHDNYRRANTAYGYADDGQGNYVRDVNFQGIYGRISQVEHIPYYMTDGVPPITTSAAPDSCAPPAYVPAYALSCGPTNTRFYSAQSASDISPTSSTSQLRRRTAFQNLAHEAGYDNTVFEGLAQEADQENITNINDWGPGPALTNMQHATVGSAPPPLPTFQRAPQPATTPSTQQPLRMANGNDPHIDHGPTVTSDHQSPPQYADVGQNIQDQPLPPHLDQNDPVGADFLSGMQELRRAGDRIQTFGASLGIQPYDLAIQEILLTNARATAHFTTGFRRAAAAAAAERESHQQTNDLLNRLRFTSRGLQGHFMATTARAEAAETRLALLLRQEEYARADLAAARAVAVGAAARTAALEMALGERRRENERLLGEVAEMERTLFGYD